ncbi:hypothetical protein WJX72_001320 [[Myrmecia] bisecta]|uniref:Peptidase S8/S53 domain-containing protein n=1 Tax=[Myrmecia] bisecta TaxID=41462 RepID=A0AAW1Q200_9CHLO
MAEPDQSTADWTKVMEAKFKPTPYNSALLELGVFKELAARIGSSGYQASPQEAQLLSAYSTNKRFSPWIAAAAGAGLGWLLTNPISKFAPRIRPWRIPLAGAAGVYSMYQSVPTVTLTGLSILASSPTPLGGEVAAILKEQRPDVYKIIFRAVKPPADQPRILRPEAAASIGTSHAEEHVNQDTPPPFPTAEPDQPQAAPARSSTALRQSGGSKPDGSEGSPLADAPLDFGFDDSVSGSSSQDQEAPVSKRQQRLERWKEIHAQKHAGHHLGQAGQAADTGTNFDPRWEEGSGAGKPRQRTNACNLQADRFKIIVQRPDNAGLFSGDFANGTANSNITSLNRTFAGQSVPIEVFAVHAQGDFQNAADLCAYLKQQNPDLQSCEPDVPANIWLNQAEMNGPGATAANGWQNGIDDDNDGTIDNIYGVNYSNGLNDPDPKDDNGHGSFVAGVVGAVGDNGIGISGVNQAASILACKFMDATGNGWVSDAIRCFDWCMGHGVHIMSNSWGGVDYSTALQTAVNQTVTQGVLVVASAGNSGYNTDNIAHIPSSMPDATILAVGASDRFGNLWSRSNFGVKTVHIAAPGVSVTSLGMNNDYIQLSGTSMATPHVAGVAALMLQKYLANGFEISTTPPSVGRAVEIKRLLMSSADPLPSPKTIASGVLDSVAALSLVPINPNGRPVTNPFGQPSVVTVAPETPAPNTAINPFSSEFGAAAAAAGGSNQDSKATIEDAVKICSLTD